LRASLTLCTVYSMQSAEAALPLRDNISDSVAAELRRRIVDGRLPAGERINEVHLAQALGVSRTPLREALSRLAAEGALTTVARFGFFVRPLTLEEFEQIYDIRPILDPEALRLAGPPDARTIERLEKLNRRLATVRDPENAIALDDEFHLLLLDRCPNRVLVEMIQNIILRTRRYELALMRETSSVERATGDHDRILDALRERDLRAACAALKRNMQWGRAPIVSWLKAREAKARPSR
jgi:DNA-binding GntR family transcriptional regulator